MHCALGVLSGEKGQGRAEQGRAGQGRAGQGRARQGRAGSAGQGRAPEGSAGGSQDGPSHLAWAQPPAYQSALALSKRDPGTPALASLLLRSVARTVLDPLGDDTHICTVLSCCAL